MYYPRNASLLHKTEQSCFEDRRWWWERKTQSGLHRRLCPQTCLFSRRPDQHTAPQSTRRVLCDDLIHMHMGIHRNRHRFVTNGSSISMRVWFPSSELVSGANPLGRLVVCVFVFVDGICAWCESHRLLLPCNLSNAQLALIIFAALQLWSKTRILIGKLVVGEQIYDGLALANAFMSNKWTGMPRYI